MSKYIIRFDDVCPKMNWEKFLKVKGLLECNNIKSVLGVVPDNQDPKLNVAEERYDFWEYICRCRDYGDTIAQHGFQHLYDTTQSGLLGINNRSEFAGHSYEIQMYKISTGKDILVRHNVWEPFFMAPAHSFDLVTLDVLKQLEFIAVTDGYGYYPYKVNGITFVPQLTSMPLDLGFGVHTLCIHINTMSSINIENLERFIFKNRSKFVDFKEVVNMSMKGGVFSRLGYFSTKNFLNLVRKLR